MASKRELLMAQNSKNKQAREENSQPEQKTIIDDIIESQQQAATESTATPEQKTEAEDTKAAAEPVAKDEESEGLNAEMLNRLKRSKQTKKSYRKCFAFTEKAIKNLTECADELGYRSANDFLNSLLEDLK